MKLIRAIFDGRSATTVPPGGHSGRRVPVIRWWPPAPATNPSTHAVAPLQTDVELHQRRCCDTSAAMDSTEPDVADGATADDYDVWSTTAAFPPDDAADDSGSDTAPTSSDSIRRSRRCRGRVKRRVQRHVTFTDDGVGSEPGPPSPTEDARRSSCNGNPLLETISAIEDLQESDDEGSEVDGGEGVTPSGDKPQLPISDGERDSNGYTSSNSASSTDSGYKSSCPALAATQAVNTEITTSRPMDMSPEISSPKSLTVQLNHSPPFFSSDPAPSTPSPPNKSTNRLDKGFYDVNLDHLMYLRQSLLGAVSAATSGKKYAVPTLTFDNSSGQEMSVQVDGPPSPQEFFLRLPGVAAIGSHFGSRAPTRTVDRHSSLTTARCGSSEATGLPPQSSSCGCPSCRHSAGAAGEDGHDNRAEYYDLENVNEFPCAYGTMVENRFNNSCLARVKKLKAETSSRGADPENVILQSGSHFHTLSRSNGVNGTAKDVANPAVLSTSDSMQHHLTPPLAVPAQTSSIDINAANASKQSSDERAHVSEVTKCILKIIDDIQQQQQHALTDSATSSNGHHQKHHRKPEVVLRGGAFNSKRSASSIYDSRRLSGADYHVYEEIAYGLAKNKIAAGKMAVGARFVGGEVQYVNVPSRKSTRLGASSLSKTRGRCSDVTSRPGISSRPPPLPARPNEIFGNCSVMLQSPSVNEAGPAKGAAQLQQSVSPVVGRRNMGRKAPLAVAAASGFTIGRKTILQTKEANDDDYGFKLIKI